MFDFFFFFFNDPATTEIYTLSLHDALPIWREMQAADPRREIPGRWLTFEPVDFIPDLQMVVQVFPYDRRLPQLSRVMNGGLRGLEPLLLARLGGEPGRWHAGDTTIEPTRYR